MNSPSDRDFGNALAQARALAARAEDEAAKQAYLDILRADPTHLAALNELGTLAYSGGFRSAARTAYLQAVQHHPDDNLARVNLANLLREEHDLAAARRHYEAALAIDPECHPAHQGLASVLNELGLEGADLHFQKGYSGHATVSTPYRGTGIGVPLLLLVSARGGNVPTQLWINERRFAVTAIYTEFWDPRTALPAHSLIVNAVGDADLCDLALTRALDIVERSAAPVINAPARVRLTGRLENAHRLGEIAGVIAPRIRALSPEEVLADETLNFPLLLRRPGFHTGQHFMYVGKREALPAAVHSLAADELFAIEYLDARGPDGMARKFRVMFVDGKAYPLHLAISADWKVHYFSAGMADDVYYRDEERRFLEDMSGVLGALAMSALEKISALLGLDFGGVDFALSPNGSLLLFEANATMAVFPPGPEPMWDYRRKAIQTVLDAATAMLLSRAGQP
jgi:glutathione synthase/RimK-type ligase-like ATP-grasp enzyme